MPQRGRVQVSITADPSGLKRGVGEAEGSLGKLEHRSHKIGAAFKVAGAAAAGALVVGLKESVDAAERAQVSQTKLEAQLKASGISYKTHAKHIDEVIQKTSKLSALDDEDLQDAFTNIVRVTGNVNKSLKLTGLAADFARAKHIDVAKAGEIVGKVAGGNTGILSRYGITLRKGASATEALGALHQKFAGQAAAYGKTAAGAQDRFRVAVENLQEKVGGALIPVMTKAANVLTNVIQWTQKHTTATKVLGIAVGALVTAFAGFVVVSKVVAALKAVRGAMVAVNVVMAANPIGAVVLAVAALGIGLVIAYKKSETFRNIVNAAFNAVKTVAVKAFGLVKTAARDGLLGPIPLIISRWGQVKDFFTSLPGHIGGVFGHVVDVLRTGANGVIKVINAAISAYNKIPLAPNLPKIPTIGAPDHRSSSGAVKVAPHQQGGLVAGQGRGDIVPAMLEPGEFVIRRQVVERFGPTFFAGLNGSSVPGPGGRFRAGGPVAHAAGGSYSYDQLAALWVRAGGNPASASIAAAVAMAESGGRSGASNRNTNGSIDRGLWQINSVHGGLSTFDVMGNAHAAVSISGNGSNWHPWVTYNTGAYRRYLHAVHPAAVNTGGAATPSGHATAHHPTRLTARLGHPLVAVAPRRQGPVVTAADQEGIEASEYGVAAAQAAITPGTADDIAAADKRRFQISQRLTKIDRALRKKHLRPAVRKRLLEEKAQLITEVAGLPGAPAAAGAGAADTTPAGDAGPAGDPNQPLIDATNANTDALNAQAAAQKAIADEMKRNNDIMHSTIAISGREAVRALADVISGQIAGTGYAPRSMTAGAGALARY